MIRIGPLDPHAGFVASDNLRLTENGLRLIRFDLEPRMNSYRLLAEVWIAAELCGETK
jgi:hypothetical protein